MSNFSSDINPQSPWWNLQSQKLDHHHHHHQQQIHKQPMFQKPLTPSDVGKLNRLVIPKQFAEKYFPLGAVNADSTEKGLLLSFEDESGKLWRFRYSYWSSSQSYVLTKGWSRYVKEKRLDAGDVVLFERHSSEFDRFYISWRRRVSPPPVATTVAGQSSGGTTGWGQVFYNAHPYPTHSHGPPITYQDECLHAGLIVTNENSAANVKGSSKRHVRLFGVNLECEPEESESEPVVSDGSSFSSDGPTHYQFYTSSNHQNHMDMNMAEDIKEIRHVHYKG